MLLFLCLYTIRDACLSRYDGRWRRRIELIQMDLADKPLARGGSFEPGSVVVVVNGRPGEISSSFAF